MIELLIFYWIFAAAFIIGSDPISEGETIGFTIFWRILLICISPIMFPLYLGDLTKKLK